MVCVKSKYKVKLRDIPNQTTYLMVLSASTLMQATHCPEIITLQLHNLLTKQKSKKEGAPRNTIKDCLTKICPPSHPNLNSNSNSKAHSNAYFTSYPIVA